ncbi:MAG: YGL010W-like membrane protein [Candidatus Latescibacterota bacterium]|jgi:uncharacterized membrane protein YGL010W
METAKTSIVEHLLTIPEAQVRIFDLKWQSTFYTVFHQTKTSKLLHTLCMAPIVFSLFALASYVEFSDAYLFEAFPIITVVNGALLVFVISAIWYLIMDITVGLVTVPIILTFWLLANAFNAVFGTDGVYLALITLFTFSFIQTLSHQPEPVPPPHSGSKKFVAFKKWAKIASVSQKIKVITLFPVFTCVELISSPRLLPVQVLRLMHRFGFRKDLEKETTERAKRVLKSGDYNAY